MQTPAAIDLRSRLPGAPSPALAPRLFVERLELAVTGTTCVDCARRIERALRALPAVYEAHVNFATQRASIAIDPTLVSRQALVEAIARAGHGVAGEAHPAEAPGVRAA